MDVRTCINCGREYERSNHWYEGRWRSQAYCSEACRHATAMERQRRRRAAAHVEPAGQPCAHCAEPFIPARSDALYCSGACRVAAHRAKRNLASSSDVRRTSHRQN